MRNEGLTARQVQAMRHDPARRIEVPAGLPGEQKAAGGLYLVLHPTGRKGWALRYRFNGRPRNWTLPKGYPDMGLAAARAEAAAALKLLADGVDPAGANAEQEQKADTMGAVVEEWLSRRVEQTRSKRFVGWILNRNVLPAWKNRRVSEIGRADVLRLLDSIVDRGSPIVANRTRSILLRLFGWCVERGYIEASPIGNIRPPVRETSRDRVLDDAELAEAWTAAESLGYPFGPFIRLCILTGQRRGEVAGMRWQDVDLEGALWTLTAEQTKPGRIHDVPLSPAAVDLLKSLPRFVGCDFVFSTTGDTAENGDEQKRGPRPISGFSKAQRRLKTEIVRMRKESGANEGAESDWTIHDLRRTVATFCASVGVPVHVLSALLNHSPGKVMGITSVYVRFRYLPERRAALERWAAHVEALASEQRKAARA